LYQKNKIIKTNYSDTTTKIENWSDIAPSPLRIPLALYKNRHFAQHWYKRFQVYLNYGKTNIVVLGRPDVGKSMLIEQLYDETGKISFEKPKESKSVESKAIALGDWTKIVRAIPGQSSTARLKGLTDAFREKQ
jgi:hypothetical protein